MKYAKIIKAKPDGYLIEIREVADCEPFASKILDKVFSSKTEAIVFTSRKGIGLTDTWQEAEETEGVQKDYRNYLYAKRPDPFDILEPKPTRLEMYSAKHKNV